MGTKQTTDTSNQYNTAANSTYNAFQPQLQSSLMQMSQNPLGNSYFQHQLSQQQAASQQIGARNNTNAIRNMRTGGGVLSNSGGFSTAMINRNNIANSGMQANAFNGAVNSALQNRNMSLTAMQAYQPLQTGQTSTQTTGGLGTWLPQLAGAALGAAGSAMTGGMGGGGLMSMFSSNKAANGGAVSGALQSGNPWAISSGSGSGNMGLNF